MKDGIQALRVQDYGFAVGAALGLTLITLVAPTLHEAVRGALEWGAAALGHLESQVLSWAGGW